MLDRILRLLKLQGAPLRCCCFHFGRCGSTLLGNMLNSHPDLEWHSELFHHYHESREASDRVEDPWDLLLTPLSQSSKRHFGFELKFQHLNKGGLDLSIGQAIDRLLELDFHHFVVLRRENYLRQAVSVARGQQTQTWHVKTDASLPKFAPVHLELDAIALGGKPRPIEACFEYLEKSYKELKTGLAKRGLVFLELSYEQDLQNDPDVALTRTLNTLALRRIRPNVSLQKINDYPLPELLSNYEQVCQRLEGTPYHWMCELKPDNSVA